MSDTSDRTVQLLNAWYEGERGALDELLAEHAQWLRRRASRELGGARRDRLDSLDLVQEGVMRLLKSGPKYAPRNRAQFRALLAKVLRSARCDEADRQQAVRRAAAREERLPSQHLSRVDAAGRTVAGPATAMDARDARDRVRRALEQLDQQERSLIQLRQNEGLSFEEVAQRLELATPDAARMRFNRAVQKLSRVLIESRAKAREEEPPEGA